MNQLIPVSYGPTKKVQPKEANMVMGYKDKFGNELVGVGIDFNKETWFGKLIESVGLKELCDKLPYQPLKVDKESALIEPIFSCNYPAKYTNIYHMLKRMREEQKMSYSSYVDSPCIGVQESNLIASNKETAAQIPQYTPNWEQAYHKESTSEQICQDSMMSLIETEEDEKSKYGISNPNITLTENYENIPTGWHPNTQPITPFNNPYENNMYSPSNTQPNPYVYNPEYRSSYLPQYRQLSNPLK